jgi:hypothetical protein
MTCNQLILLLEIYRGQEVFAVSTTGESLAVLKDKRLIEMKAGGVRDCTHRGHQVVESILGLLSSTL